MNSDIVIHSKGLVPAPTADKRWRIVSAVMRKHGFARSALIEALHSVQSVFGYLDQSSMLFVASSLGVPPSQVYGVATFYGIFRLKPQGKHTCVVCMGTACYIKGGPKLLTAVEVSARIKEGETTPDNQVSLVVARCLGACGIAPAAVFDGEVVGNLSTNIVQDKICKWLGLE